MYGTFLLGHPVYIYIYIYNLWKWLQAGATCGLDTPALEEYGKIILKLTDVAMYGLD